LVTHGVDYVPAQNALEASLFAGPSLADEREYTFSLPGLAAMDLAVVIEWVSKSANWGETS
jgi:hypothetical protein